ncbi:MULTISPECIES: BPL-N domain-containing protein [unclassified Pantoea]|uniref:BPL-N domain-containing protein n=1 Tax=unclassified Pantoea TaxID=2630326 RepID=UPI00351D02A4
MHHIISKRQTTLASAMAVVVGFYSMTFATAALSESAEPTRYQVAIYRGEAGCAGCAEMVDKALKNSGLPLTTSYVGEHEKLKLNDNTLKRFDLYIQPGGGQDIPAAYQALGTEGANAIRRFVKNGKRFLGICMGAYLADKNNLGLIDASLASEVGRPGSGVTDEGDYALQVRWNKKEEPFYYQDGPHLNNSQEDKAIAYYAHGDIAIAKYRYGKGTVILSGPHPEADETWLGEAATSSTTPGNKMARLMSELGLKKN